MQIFNTCFIKLSKQGDHIGQFFANCYFWKVIYSEDKVAQGNGDMLGLLLFKTIIYICTYIKSFKTYFVVIILKFQKWFDVDVFLLQNCALISIIRLFGLAAVLAIFWKNWAIFFKSIGHIV